MSSTPFRLVTTKKSHIWLAGFSVLLGLLLFTGIGKSYAMSAGALISLTNQERASAGLGPLHENGMLDSSAAAKGADMLARDYWSHYAPDGTSPWYFISQSGYRYAAAGENLGMDFTDDSTLMSAWMNSPEHRANIMNSSYQDIGIAVLYGSLLGHDTTLVVVHFGQPIAAPAPAPAPAPVAAPAASSVPAAAAPADSAPADPTPAAPAAPALATVTKPVKPQSSVKKVVKPAHPVHMTGVQLLISSIAKFWDSATWHVLYASLAIKQY